MREAALITGGAKRIGKEIALLLSVLGYDIALHHSRSADEAKKTATEIENNGAACELFKCDLENEKQTLTLIGRIKRRFPHLRLFINSASIFERSTLAKLDLHSLNKHFSVNFKAPYILSCEFARLCKKGQIINLLDTNIVKNKTAYVNYLLSKKSLANFTEIAAAKFAPHIRVNGIAPGLILPPKNKNDEYLNRLAKNIPLQKRGNPNQIALAVQYFVESEYTTGQILFVDGGEHLL